MIQEKYDKLVNGQRLQNEIIAAGLPMYPAEGARFYGVVTNNSAEGDEAVVMCYDDITQEEVDTIDVVVAAHIPIPVGNNDLAITVGPDDISGQVDDTWTIPSGEMVSITSFMASSQSSKCSRTSIYYDPNGDGTDMEVIDVIFACGSAPQNTITNANYVGDGTAKIRVRRECSKGSANMFARWEGSY